MGHSSPLSPVDAAHCSFIELNKIAWSDMKRAKYCQQEAQDMLKEILVMSHSPPSPVYIPYASHGFCTTFLPQKN